MAEYKAKHLVLVRHGESEGDVRRAMLNQPQSHKLTKHPRDEGQTKHGHEQSRIAGQWIARHVLGAYSIKSFDLQLTSPLIRTQESAYSLGLNGIWKDDDRLAERDRGKIQGMTKSQHRGEFPESYKKMTKHPFHWTPPGGESLLRVAARFGDLSDDFMKSQNTSAVFMTHRDLLWAAHIPLESMSLTEVEQIDSDFIYNGQVLHYTNVDPKTIQIDGTNLVWKRSVTPWSDTAHKQTAEWVKLGER